MSKNYANLVKEERARTFGSAYDFVYTIFEELEFHNKDKNISSIMLVKLLKL